MYYKVLFFLLFVPMNAYGGAWTLEKNKTNFSLTHEIHRQNYLYHAEDLDRGNTRQYQTKETTGWQARVEYGVTDSLTTGVSYRWQSVYRHTNLRTSNNSCNHYNACVNDYSRKKREYDYDLYFRKLLYKNSNTVISVQPLVAFPSADAELRLLYGRNFEYQKKPNFINIELAARHSLGKPDEIKFDVTHGVEVVPSIKFISQIMFTSYCNKTSSKKYKHQSFFDQTGASQKMFIKDPSHQNYRIKTKLAIVKQVTQNIAANVGFTIVQDNKYQPGYITSLGLSFSL